MQVASDAQRLFDRARRYPREGGGGYKVGYQDDSQRVLVLGDLQGYGQIREFIFEMSLLGYQPLILGEPDRMQHCDFVFAHPGPDTLDSVFGDDPVDYGELATSERLNG